MTTTKEETEGFARLREQMTKAITRLAPQFTAEKLAGKPLSYLEAMLEVITEQSAPERTDGRGAVRRDSRGRLIRRDATVEDPSTQPLRVTRKDAE